MKRILAFFILINIGSMTAFSQPFALALNNVDGSPYTCNLLEDLGIYKRLRVVATQNSSSGTWEFPALCSFPGNVYRPYTSGTAPIPFNAIIPPIPGTAAALYNSGNGGASGNLSPVTNGNLYTFNIQNTFSASASPYFCVLETNYTPVSIPTVTQVPDPNAIGPDNVVEVTINCSAPPHTGENVFVRYTTDNFNSTSIVQASFIGATGKATIPNFPFGTTVKYYVYSSSKSKALIESEAALYGEIVHDMSTLDWNTNIAQNYSYTVTNIVPLQVEFIRGQKNGAHNDLSWKVNCGSGSMAQLILERSRDARMFSPVYEQYAQGTECSQVFSFRDAQVPAGTLYYRLKMMEGNGRPGFSPVIAILDRNTGIESLGIYPSPVGQSPAMLNMSAGKATPLDVSIRDISGNMVFKQTYRLVAGSNQVSLDLSGLAPGMYFIYTATATGSGKVLRFIKQ